MSIQVDRLIGYCWLYNNILNLKATINHRTKKMILNKTVIIILDNFLKFELRIRKMKGL